MKNIVVKILLSLSLIVTTSLYAADAPSPSTTVVTSADTSGTNPYPMLPASSTNTKNTSTAPTTPKTMKIITTEEVPGAIKCTCIATEYDASADNRDVNDRRGLKASAPTKVSCQNVATRKYECEVGVGFSQFQIFFASVIRMVINITILLGVLAVVGLGIAWSLAGGDDVKAKSSLKSWAINIIAGVVILFFFRYILMFLAPWIYN